MAAQKKPKPMEIDEALKMAAGIAEFLRQHDAPIAAEAVAKMAEEVRYWQEYDYDAYPRTDW